MIKKVTEIKAKEGEDISVHIAKFVEEYNTDPDVTDTVSLNPQTGLTEDGKKYALWLGRNTAVFALRKSKDRVILGLIKDRNFENVVKELEKHGIVLQGFSIEPGTENIWSQLRACMFAALSSEPTDEFEEPEQPEAPEEPEERESRERPESPVVPFESTDFDVLDEASSDMVKAGEALDKKAERSRRGPSNSGSASDGEFTL